MKNLMVVIACLGLMASANAQPDRSQPGQSNLLSANSILESIENGGIEVVGDHYVITNTNIRSTIGMTFKTCQGVGIDRKNNEWWVLPIGTNGSEISANANLWVLPENAVSVQKSWYIKLEPGDSLTARLDGVLKVQVRGKRFSLYQSETRPHSDAFNNRYSFKFSDSDVLADALAGFYWGTMLPSIVERTKAKDYPYNQGFVVSTLNPSSYAGTYPDVDHEFQIKGRLAMGSALDVDVVRRMIALQFKVMDEDPEKLYRIPCAIQPSGIREYDVRRNSQDLKNNADMFLLTGNIEVLEESWRYYEATKNTEWLKANISNLEHAASWTTANTDQYGRVWSDVYYEDQVIQDGRVTEAGAFAANTFDLLARMERVLHREQKATYYAGYSRNIAAALIRPLPLGFWDEKNQRFVDWIDRSGDVHDHIHLLSNTLPVLFGYASEEQGKAVRSLIDGNLASFQRFPSFVAVDIAGYTKSEIGSGGPYDLSAAGRYWYWDAALWKERRRNDVLLKQLITVANEGARSNYFMGERYDMDYVYYLDGKNSHGAEMYYEYPCVFTSVLITDLLGLSTSEGANVFLQPHLTSYGDVEFGIPRYSVRYTYAAEGFTLTNTSNELRHFKTDLSALYGPSTKFKLVQGTKSRIVSAVSTIELASHEYARWILLSGKGSLQ